jgi:hypothetical protein
MVLQLDRSLRAERACHKKDCCHTPIGVICMLTGDGAGSSTCKHTRLLSVRRPYPYHIKHQFHVIRSHPKWIIFEPRCPGSAYAGHENTSFWVDVAHVHQKRAAAQSALRNQIQLVFDNSLHIVAVRVRTWNDQTHFVWTDRSGSQLRGKVCWLEGGPAQTFTLNIACRIPWKSLNKSPSRKSVPRPLCLLMFPLHAMAAGCESACMMSMQRGIMPCATLRTDHSSSPAHTAWKTVKFKTLGHWCSQTLTEIPSFSVQSGGPGNGGAWLNE